MQFVQRLLGIWPPSPETYSYSVNGHHPAREQKKRGLLTANYSETTWGLATHTIAKDDRPARTFLSPADVTGSLDPPLLEETLGEAVLVFMMILFS